MPYGNDETSNNNLQNTHEDVEIEGNNDDDISLINMVMMIIDYDSYRRRVKEKEDKKAALMVI